jgi:hypothetical protein
MFVGPNLLDHVWRSHIFVDEVEGVEYHFDREIVLLPEENGAVEPNDSVGSHPGRNAKSGVFVVTAAALIIAVAAFIVVLRDWDSLLCHRQDSQDLHTKRWDDIPYPTLTGQPECQHCLNL